MIKLNSPAKVNLTLLITGKRDDGYHEIESIMHRVELFDILKFSHADSINLTCNIPELQNEKNLVYKAALLLKENTGYKYGANIILTKYIPMQAGLGGGSSNAATTLIGLNELWNTGLKQNELVELAAKIGSDVPFFLMGEAALAQGRGEKLTPITDSCDFDVVIVKPTDGLDTGTVYKTLNAPPFSDKNHLQQETTMMMHALKIGHPIAVGASLCNDLQEPAFSLMPELKEIHDKMEEMGALGILLCGSGSSTFAICDSAEIADTIGDKFKKDGYWTWVGKFI
jgi:4-diphosphocytidyl-2-C-methyl-D-erythritol kinase